MKLGVRLEEPDRTLADEYLRKAERAFDAMETLEKNPEWCVAAAYYAMYFSLSAILMRAGITSKIHTCTIALMELFDFTQEEIERMERAMHARIEAQYALDPDVEIEEIIEYAPRFSLRCRTVMLELDDARIEKIRKRIASERSPDTPTDPS